MVDRLVEVYGMLVLKDKVKVIFYGNYEGIYFCFVLDWYILFKIINILLEYMVILSFGMLCFYKGIDKFVVLFVFGKVFDYIYLLIMGKVDNEDYVVLL